MSIPTPRERAALLELVARPTFVLAAVACLAVAAIAGCAAASRAPLTRAGQLGPPRDQNHARRQIALLEHDIRRARRMLGLRERRITATGGAATKTPARVEPRLHTQSNTPPAPVARSEAAGTKRLAGTASSSDSSVDRCRTTKAICRAAKKICQLADFIADDDARRRCSKARGDCRQAKRRTSC